MVDIVVVGSVVGGVPLKTPLLESVSPDGRGVLLSTANVYGPDTLVPSVTLPVCPAVKLAVLVVIRTG